MQIIFLVLILSFLLVLCGVALHYVGWAFPSLLLRGAPYVPTGEETVATMIRLANICADDTVVDLGSGDGRIVIAAAKAGARISVGYEIQPRLLWLSRKYAKHAEVSDKTVFHWKSMWDADVSKVTVVFLYQITYAMPKLSKKLQTELPPGARVISSGFTFPHWEPVQKEGGVTMYRM